MVDLCVVSNATGTAELLTIAVSAAKQQNCARLAKGCGALMLKICLDAYVA